MARKSTTAEDVEWGEWDDKEMKKRWTEFMKFGNHDAKEINGKNLDKWLKDAGVLDSKHITTTMTGIAFSNVARGKKTVDYNTCFRGKKTVDYKLTKDILVKVAEDRATKSKKTTQDELDLITEKLANLEGPRLSSTTKANSSGVYNRLTDTSKYTGASKERFDQTGKGKGKAGREEVPDKSGYVASYKNKGSYDQTHGK